DEGPDELGGCRGDEEQQRPEEHTGRGYHSYSSRRAGSGQTASSGIPGRPRSPRAGELERERRRIVRAVASHAYHVTAQSVGTPGAAGTLKITNPWASLWLTTWSPPQARSRPVATRPGGFTRSSIRSACSGWM